MKRYKKIDEKKLVRILIYGVGIVCLTTIIYHLTNIYIEGYSELPASAGRGNRTPSMKANFPGLPKVSSPKISTPDVKKIGLHHTPIQGTRIKTKGVGGEGKEGRAQGTDGRGSQGAQGSDITGSQGSQEKGVTGGRGGGGEDNTNGITITVKVGKETLKTSDLGNSSVEKSVKVNSNK